MLTTREFPWFQDATIRQITAVERPSPHHLYWPKLDVDLAVDSLEHPERYPLISRTRSNQHLQSAKARRQAGTKRRTRTRLRG